MKNEYHNSLHNLDMSQERKSALIDLIAQEIEATQTKPNIIEMPKKSKRRLTPFKLAVAVAACVALGTGVAYATGNLVSVGQAFGKLFGGEPANTEIVDTIGKPIGASATDNGVTISADAIIGDRQSYSIIYSITFEDGIPEGFETDENHSWIMDGGSSVEGTDGAAGGAYFYDDNPDDSTIYYVEQFMVASEDSVVGKTCSVHFDQIINVISGNIISENEATNNTYEAKAQGNWNFSFVIDYIDSSVEFGSNDMQSAGLTGCFVSPVSVTLTYIDAEPSIEIEVEPTDLEIVMQDGSVMGLDLDTFAMYEHPTDAGYQYVINCIFDKTIDVNSIQCVRLGPIEMTAKS